MARLVSLTALTVLMVFLGITFYRVVAPFLLPLFLAGVMAMIGQPAFRWLIEKTGGRTRISAALMTTAMIVVLFIPLLLGTFIATIELFVLAKDKLGSKDWKQTVARVRHELDIDHLAKRILPYVKPTQTDGEPAPPTNDVEDDREISSADPDSSNETRLRDVDELQIELEENLRTALRSIVQRTMGFAGVAAASVPGAAVGLLEALVAGIIGTLTFVVALYYFLADGPALLAASEQLVPVHVDYQRELRNKFGSAVRAVVSATFLAAVAQGLLTATALWLTGFGNFIVFFVLGTLGAMIPLVGTLPIWGPCAIWLALHKDWGAAIFLVAIGTLVIGTADNVIRTYVLHSDAKLHPLLAFISVLGGVQVMGLWGIFVGPIIASCLHALVKIFNIELKEFSKERFTELAEPPPNAGTLAAEANPLATENAGKVRAGATKNAAAERPENAQPPKPGEQPPSPSAPADGGNQKRSKRRRRQKR